MRIFFAGWNLVVRLSKCTSNIETQLTLSAFTQSFLHFAGVRLSFIYVAAKVLHNYTSGNTNYTHRYKLPRTKNRKTFVVHVLVLPQIIIGGNDLIILI